MGESTVTSDEELVTRFTTAQEDLVLQSADLSLRTLAGMVDSGAIDVSPQFQRRDRWTVAKQAALIESFLLNIPVPPIYLAEDDLGTYSAIDGKQRITAIRLFLQDEFSLRGLIRFPEMEGRYFSQLPRVIQNALDLRPLRTVTLLKQSDQELKYEVFHRLNTGGEILNPQEIRNVAYRGPLNDEIYQLADHPFLRQQLKISSAKSSAFQKMTDAEYVLRFLTLSRDWMDFSGDLSRSMNLFMLDHRNTRGKALSALSARFVRSLEACEAIYGANAFKRFEDGSWRNQALAGMYDAEMVAMFELSDDDVSKAVTKSTAVVEMTTKLFDDREFETAVRQGTNTPARVRYRVSTLVGAIRSSL